LDLNWQLNQTKQSQTMDDQVQLSAAMTKPADLDHGAMIE
jgi:hypothetical protein